MKPIKILRAEACLNTCSDIIQKSNAKKRSRTSASVNELNIEDFIQEQASPNPGASQDFQMELRPEMTEEMLTDIETAPIVSNTLLEERQITPDTIITNNYHDDVRGNVFISAAYDSLYKRPVHTYTSVDELPHHDPEYQFLASDAVANLVANPFSGIDLPQGATISMWVRLLDYSAINDMRGLVLFMNNLKTIPHPSHPTGSTIEYQSHLSINCDGSVIYDDAFSNFYKKLPNYDNLVYSRGHRIGRKWEHLIVSVSEDDSILYVNGKKFDDYLSVYRGKRFAKKNAANGKNLRPSMTEFISSPDTKLFLAVTADNESTISDRIMFDDVKFYDTAVSDETALELYEEALSINLP